MCEEDHRMRLVRRDLEQLAQEAAAGDGVEARERLVEHQQVRPVTQAPAASEIFCRSPPDSAEMRRSSGTSHSFASRAISS